jgi:hypothetical protein
MASSMAITPSYVYVYRRRSGRCACCTSTCACRVECSTAISFNYLGDYGGPDVQKKLIEELMIANSVWIREGAIKPTSKDLSAAYKKDISFVGRDAVALGDLAEEMLDIMIPPEQRAEDEDIAEEPEHARALRCWTTYRPLWRLLTNDFVDVNDEQERNKRADEVQKLSDDWLEAWVEAVGYT